MFCVQVFTKALKVMEKFPIVAEASFVENANVKFLGSFAKITVAPFNVKDFLAIYREDCLCK